MSPKRYAFTWITFFLILIAEKLEGYPAGAKFYNSEVSGDIERSEWNREASNNDGINFDTEFLNEAPSKNPEGRKIVYWSEDFGGEIISQRTGNDHKLITITKKIGLPIEKSIHYPLLKKILYPVKIPFIQRYAVEKEIPYPVKVYVKMPIKIPKPVAVVKEIPYPVKVPVSRPVPHRIYIPRPYPVEKIIHYKVEVPIPEPFPIEREIPVPVRIQEHIAQPYPVEKEQLYPVEIEVEKQIADHESRSHQPPIEKPLSYLFQEKGEAEEEGREGETPITIVEYPKNRQPWLREEEKYRATDDDDFHSKEDWNYPKKIER